MQKEKPEKDFNSLLMQVQKLLWKPDMKVATWIDNSSSSEKKRVLLNVYLKRVPKN